jgi:hypothetical protein
VKYVVQDSADRLYLNDRGLWDLSPWVFDTYSAADDARNDKETHPIYKGRLVIMPYDMDRNTSSSNCPDVEPTQPSIPDPPAAKRSHELWDGQDEVPIPYVPTDADRAEFEDCITRESYWSVEDVEVSVFEGAVAAGITTEGMALLDRQELSALILILEEARELLEDP